MSHSACHVLMLVYDGSQASNPECCVEQQTGFWEDQSGKNNEEHVSEELNADLYQNGDIGVSIWEHVDSYYICCSDVQKLFEHSD